MHAQAPEHSARPSQRGFPLWLGAVLLLALLLATPLTKAEVEQLAHPGDQIAPAGLELAFGEASPDAWLTAPSDLPHCHHDHAWRPPSGILPRSEAPDSAPEATIPATHIAGPPHLTSPLGHAHPGPTVRHSVPLYLLTQRFRS